MSKQHELRSLDLFSGIGGFARALHGIARPVAMCDLDPDAREVLRCRMVERKMPSCPVFDDVRALTADSLPLAVDLVVGGWPCQDLSSVGLRRGLGGARSGLVREVFRLIDETGAQGALLENVPQLLSSGFPEVLEAFVFERGFDVSWCVLPACAVGAPHIRKRLFMWVRKPTFEYEWPEGSLFYEPHDWSRKAEPQRMELPNDSDPIIKEEGQHRNKRQMLLGNSVVPDCLRSAFMVLASGFRKPPKADATNLRLEVPSMNILKRFIVDKEKKTRQVLPKWGYARRVDNKIEMYSVLPKHVPELKTPCLDLVLSPDVYKWDGPLQVPKYGMERSPLLKELMPIVAWSTPRTVTCAANSLTQRVTRDLPTQVRYEIGTPDAQRSGQITTAFVEWLMAYPKGWTRLPSSWKTTSPVGYRPGGLKQKMVDAKAKADAAALLTDDSSLDNLSDGCEP